MSKRLNPKKRTKNPRLRDATDIIERSMNGSGIASTFNVDIWDYDIEEFDSLEAIFKDMKKRIHFGVDWASRYAYEALGVAIENWYNDYEPTKYVRSETLYNAPEVWVSGYGGHVSINLSSHYDMEQILENAEQGIHGSTFYISGNDVVDWRRAGDKGIGIWGELIYFLMTTEWSDSNSSTYASMGNIDNAPMLNYAFDAGVFANGKALFGRK